MTLQIFLALLLAVSIFTGLFTEGIKRYLDEKGKSYRSNALAGYVAVALSVIVGAAYVILASATINASLSVYLIALMLLSWLCAMVGYDKVIQSIAQFRKVDQTESEDKKNE